MANDYFQFKQFLIHQGDCAMKVTTEGCLFGALAFAEQPKRILDIGTGTGLLALMLAQKYPKAEIQAVEFDQSAFDQAKANFTLSQWSDNLRVGQAAIQSYQTKEQFDLIICNPPFFANSLRSDQKSKNLAIHDSSLSQHDLAHCINELLAKGGVFWVLYPEREALMFRDEAERKGLFLNKAITVLNHPKSMVFRIVQQFSFEDKKVISSELIIKDQEGSYTQDFEQLLSPYYLHL